MIAHLKSKETHLPNVQIKELPHKGLGYHLIEFVSNTIPVLEIMLQSLHILISCAENIN